MIFFLDLLKGDGSLYTLTIESGDSELGIAWAKLLKASIDNGAIVTEPERIYYLNDKWDPALITEEMIKCIHIVNSYKKDTIIYKDNLNYLHKYFEDFVQPGNQFFDAAPTEVRQAIRELNILIHRLEHMARQRSEKIVVSLSKRPRYEMTIDQALEFKRDIIPGDVMIKYCHKGKKITDIFTDDELDNRHIGNNNIKPQKKISADFKIYLSDPTIAGFWDKFDIWINNNMKFFNDVGIDLNNPMNTIGFGKVGSIVGDINNIKKEIYGVTKIYNVRYN